MLNSRRKTRPPLENESLSLSRCTDRVLTLRALSAAYALASHVSDGLLRAGRLFDLGGLAC